MVNGNVGFGKDEMCSYKHTHNGAVHIRAWLGATGRNDYLGITFEGFYSAIATGAARGINAAETLCPGSSNTLGGSGFIGGDIAAAIDSYLGPLGEGFLDAPITTAPIPAIDKTDSGSGIFIDGLEVSSFAYNAFVDNTLREDIINVASNNSTFGYANGQYYDNSQMMFGSGKTNREVREEQNRQDRKESEELYLIYEFNKSYKKNSKKQQNSYIEVKSKELTPSFGPDKVYEQEISTTKNTIINFNNFGNPDLINILNLDGSPLHEVTGGEYQKSTHTANFYRIFQKNNLPLNEPHNFILQIIGGPKTNQYPDTHWKYTMYNGFLEGNYRIFRLMTMPKF